MIADIERRSGRAHGRWTYLAADGQPVGIVLRWDAVTPSGKATKEILPVSLLGGEWRVKAMPAPRPLLHLPELVKLPAGAWVYVCEGEKAVDAARVIGLVATTSSGGSKGAAQTDWSPLRDKVVVVVPDNDEPGEAYADEVVALCQQASAEEVRVLRLWEHWPALLHAGDIVDVLALEGGDAEAVHERIDELALATKREPVAVEGRPRVPRYRDFPVDALPEPIRSYVVEGAAAIGCDASFVALPMLSGLAGAIGNTRRIVLKRGWVEPAILWTAIVGESGTQKSPAFRLALRAVRTRQHRLLKEHQQALKQWEADSQRYEIAFNEWKKQAAKGRAAPEPPVAPEKPICPRTWIEDCTTEALATLLQENPRGLLTLRNELSGWFSFGQYKNGGGADDVARWLQMFDADPLIVDRKTSGTVYVASAAVSIAGGIQPAILERSVGREHRDNGLLARLLLAHPPRRAKRWTEAELDPLTDGAVTVLFDRLYAIEPERDADGDPTPKPLGLDAAAKAAWIDFVNEHGEEQLALVGDEAAAWSKLEGYAARLALIVHLVRAAADDPTLADREEIDAASIDSGIRLSRWFAAEALRIYGALAADEGDRETRRLLELLERQPGPVSVREWQRIRSVPTAANARAELDGLAAAGHGRWEDTSPGPKGGRPSRRFVLAGGPHPSDGSPPTGQQGGRVAATVARVGMGAGVSSVSSVSVAAAVDLADPAGQST
ncbi:MAG TPA: DUF3987 domain-containing protein [Phycisphaerales bacterium]|nr:DUF3987 domain-containing protein [Phycisphaerales bacterium]HMP37880.1 DUF3987 domain-containing protein [Phycisphaerales bacterium]